MALNYAAMLLIFIHIVLCDSHMESRSLYDLNLPDNKIVNVSTVANGLSTPVGIASGYYLGSEGIFFSSFSNSDINFITTNRVCEETGSCTVTKVAGTGASGVSDGSLSQATFADPSRMIYLEDLKRLVLTDRSNGFIRYIDFVSSTVGTMKTSTGSKLTLLGSAVSDNNPELDIKQYGEYFYVSDSQSVYNITGSDGTLSGSFSAAVMTRYRALKTWQQANDYDISTAKIFISSIAVNTRTEELYVAYTFSRSAIVRMPLRCQSSSEVSVYVSDGVKYNIPQTYPRPRNGNLNSAKVMGFSLVTFPMHMEYDGDDNVLYWVEVYSHLSSGTSVGALGAVAVRRLQLDTLEVDYYAGNEGSFRSIIGRSTGYKDGFSNKAQFSYPVTLSFYSSTGKLGTGPQLYVADYGNSAIRRVSTWVDTPSPTLAPTISQRPTVAPTVSHRPTSSPTVAPTIRPTSPPSLFPTVAPSSSSPTSSAPTSSPTPLPSAEPTLAPTVSHAPTLQMAPTSIPTALNGDCLL